MVAAVIKLCVVMEPLVRSVSVISNGKRVYLLGGQKNERSKSI